MKENTGITAKFFLLLWKNWVLQTRHPFKTAIEIFVPILMVVILAIMRTQTEPVHYPCPRPYNAYQVDSFPSKLRPFQLPMEVLNNEVVYNALSEMEALDMRKERGGEEDWKERFEDLIEDIVNWINGTNTTDYTWPVLYTPDTQITRIIMQETEKRLSITTEGLGFSTEDEMVESFNVSNVLCGVVFSNIKEVMPDQVEIKIRMPAIPRLYRGESSSWETDIVFPGNDDPRPREKNKGHGGYPGYWENGFLALQHALSMSITTIMMSHANEDPFVWNVGESDFVDNFNVTVEINRFTYPRYTYDELVATVQFFLSGVFLLGFVYPAIEITKSVTYEKEKRIKESMKMMGLPNWLHWCAWFTKSFLLLLIPVLLMPILLCVRAGDKVALLEHSSFGFVLLFLIIFAVGTVSFAFMISAFYSKANAGATATAIIWLLTYCPYYFIQPRYLSLNKAEKLSASTLHVTGMALVCQIIGMQEASGVGVTFDNINENANADDNITVAQLLIMMSADAVVYMIITWYVEAVFPGDYGIPQPFYFPFTKRYWFPQWITTDATIEVTLPSDRVNKDLFEKDPNQPVGISIKGLSKMYKGAHNLAVDNLRLNMYEGQITALLGHNGAGKTTTMSMITGLFPPTAGTATVNGYDVVKDIELVRSSMGLCPQHDVLFDELTCEEHLHFFCKLKGMTPELSKLQTDYFLTSLDIENKRHKQVHTLSGGMKRKLSVAIALCGGSKVVMLDEPTSGMDPQARRCTWDLLLNEREGRTILLSTHFMDEADLLGDRIAIMSAGKVHCCGSSLFLKKKFGAGYHLVMVKDKECDINKVMAMITSHIPTADLHQNVGAELAVILPDHESSCFPDMFEQLEDEKRKLKISSYGLSHTTMEEVFIRVGETTDEQLKRELDAINNKETNDYSNEMPCDSDSESDLESKTTEQTTVLEQCNTTFDLEDELEDEIRQPYTTPKLWQQIYSQIVKKYLYTIRNWKLCLIQIVAPLIYVTLAILIDVTKPSASHSSPLSLTLDQYDDSVNLFCARGDPHEINEIKNIYEEMIREFGQSNDIREDGTDDMSNYTYRKAESMNLADFNRLYITGAQFFIYDKESFHARAWFNNEPFHAVPLTLSVLDNTLMKYFTENLDAHVNFINHPMPITKAEKIEQSSTTNASSGYVFAFNLAFGMSFMAASFVLIIIRENATKAKHLQLVAGLGCFRYWMANFLYDFSLYFACCLVLCGILAAFQQEGLCEGEQIGRLLIVLTFYGVSMLPTMYVLSFLFTVPSMGFVLVAIINLITGVGTLMTITMLKTSAKKLDHVADALEWVFLFFPNYSLSMAIQDIYVNFFSLEYCKRYPPGLIELSCQIEFLQNACCAPYGGHCGSDPCAQHNFFTVTPMGAGRELLFMMCSAGFFILILASIENRIFQRIGYWIRTRNTKKYKGGLLEDYVEDDDVYKERVRVTKVPFSRAVRENHLLLLDLTKYYGGDFLAVDKLCLGVTGQECFGLLGVNGAGKTTTFKMLTGDEIITRGDAFVDGFSCTSDIKQVQQRVGYCPQFDAILGQMTGYENLQLFCRIHGVPEKEIDGVIHNLARDFYFEGHLNKLSKAYSGGNKRKLSTAIALVGRPGIVFLDEPTSGMDPVARRLLWDAISKVRDSGTSIVLTSHSMDECEALCTRLAIMVNGRFQCLGSTQHLKSKFGQGYTIIIRIGTRDMQTVSELDQLRREGSFRSFQKGHRRVTSGLSNISMHTLASYSRNRAGTTISRIATEKETDELKDFIEEAFPGAILKDSHQGMVQYQIESPDVSWAEIFRTIEDNAEKYNIEDYSVGQTTLEQIFLGFAKKQRNEDDKSSQADSLRCNIISLFKKRKMINV